MAIFNFIPPSTISSETSRCDVEYLGEDFFHGWQESLLCMQAVGTQAACYGMSVPSLVSLLVLR